jgi:hypothetical protein
LETFSPLIDHLIGMILSLENGLMNSSRKIVLFRQNIDQLYLPGINRANAGWVVFRHPEGPISTCWRKSHSELSKKRKSKRPLLALSLIADDCSLAMALDMGILNLNGRAGALRALS